MLVGFGVCSVPVFHMVIQWIMMIIQWIEIWRLKYQQGYF